MVRVIRFNAFSSKAVKRILHGRSSDLFLLRAPSRNTLPVALSRLLATYLWNLQQRDCSGFTPDSLLIASLVMRVANQCGDKDIVYLFLPKRKQHQFCSHALTIHAYPFIHRCFKYGSKCGGRYESKWLPSLRCIELCGVL